MSNLRLPNVSNLVPQQNGNKFNQNQQQLKNMMAYNQLDLSPGIREALMAAQGNAMQMQQQQQFQTPQQMEMAYGINSARNIMAFGQQQGYQPPPNDYQFQQMRQPQMMHYQDPNIYGYAPQKFQQSPQPVQQDYMGSQYHFINQQQPLPQPQVVPEEVKEGEDLDDNIDEFDSEFLLNNPGIVQTQKYFQQNYENVISSNQMSQEQMPVMPRDDSIWRNMHINLACNNYNHKKKFGLNKNKRGRIKDTDFQRLQNSIRNQFSQRNEHYLNQQFGQQPQIVVQKYRQNKAKLDQQFMHRQYQSQGNILQVLSNLDEQIAQISNSQSFFQNQLQNQNFQPEQPKPQQAQPQPYNNPQAFMVDMQQDALQRIRDQVKEELKEELKNQIRQELIDQLPKESKEALTKKNVINTVKPKEGASNQMLQRQQKPSKFAQLNHQLSEAVDSNDSRKQKSSNGSRQNLVKQIDGQNGSLNHYKFGMINNEQEEGNSNDKGSKNSKQSYGADSDQLESERLRRSYDQYGKMINEQNNKKIDYKKSNIKVINEDQDSDYDQNGSVELSKDSPKKPTVKQNRSSSLAPFRDDQNDLIAKQIDQINKAQKRQQFAKRNNSIHVGNALQKRDSKCGTEGGNDHIRNFNQYHNDGYFDDDENNGSYDFLQIQIEDERLKMLNEIHQIVQRQDNRDDDIDESNLNNKLKLICKNMMDLNIDYSVSKILELSKKEKRILRDLIKKYQEILMHQSKYVNVEHLDNELKSDVDAEYDDEDEDEDEEENKSESDEESGSSYKSEVKKKKKKKQQHKSEVEDNSDNDVQYENYKPKIDPKAIKIREERRGSVISIGSRRVKQQQKMEQEPKKKNQKMSKKFDSDSNDEDDDDDDDGEEQHKCNELAKSPSLAEIKRSSSYCSIDSKVKKQAAKKFDPKLLKIRDDGSCRGSIRSRSSKTSKKGFMQDMVSERSGNRRQLSLYRRDKLQGLELDYHEYLQQHQGIFIIRCQMMNIELSKIREKYDLEKMMIEFKNFKKLQKEIKQDEVYRGLQTVIIDIENTFVTLIEVKNKEELDAIKEYENFQSDYIIIKKNVSKKSKKEKSKSKQEDQPSEPDICCEYKGTDRCICDLLVYLVRPYTYEILRAIQPFFEIVVFSKLHHKILEHIIDHIESILNKPIKEFLEKYQKSMNKSSFQRMKKLPDVKIYFQFIIHQRQYIHIKDHDKHIENLLVLTKNRPKDNLIFISSNPFRIVTAIKYGFLTIPVIQFESFYRDDYQLSLVEHYILKIRHLKDMKKRLRQDFKCLVQKIENQPCKVPNYIKNLQAQSKQFDNQSQGSFGGKKLKQKIHEKKEKEPKNDSPVPPVKKVDPALLKQSKQPVIQQGKDKFKPRKSSFGNISFGDPLNKNRRQPQSDSEEDLEDYDDEECEQKIAELENQIMKGEIKEEKPAKKKLLFTKIEENKIDENDEKEDEDDQPEQNNQSFSKNQNNPQEQQACEKKPSNASNSGIPQQKNPFSSFFRPGLDIVDEKRNSCQDFRKIQEELAIDEEDNHLISKSLSQGGINERPDIMNNSNNGPVIVNQGNIVMNINKNVIHQNVVKSSSSQNSSLKSNNPSKNSNSNQLVDESQSPGSDEGSIKAKTSNSFYKNSNVQVQNSFSEDSSNGVKFFQGKVVYDANKVILEESKDNSYSQVAVHIHKPTQKKKTYNSDFGGNKSSNMASEIDEIYAELDFEQQNEQIQRINQQIEQIQNEKLE